MEIEQFCLFYNLIDGMWFMRLDNEQSAFFEWYGLLIDCKNDLSAYTVKYFIKRIVKVFRCSAPDSKKYMADGTYMR